MTPRRVTPGPRYYDAEEISRRLDLDTTYRSQIEAFRCLGTGEAELAERLILAGGGPSDDALAFCYVARLRPGTPPVCKFGAVAAGNKARGLPTVHAVVVALDAHTGEPTALFDGEAITTLRTPAATAVALDHLAPPTARTLAVIGCGVQGRAHLRALAHARDLAEIRLFDHTPGNAVAAARAAETLGVRTRITDSARDAVAAADLVVTCTSSAEPVLSYDWLAPGATVVSIGSFAPDRLEVDATLVARAATVAVDHAPTALRQAGPVVAAVAAGYVAPADLIQLGDVVAHGRRVRTDPREVVYYNSVGLGVQDAAAVSAILEGPSAP